LAQELKKLNASDIRLNEALKFSVYDEHGTLLLRKGIVVKIPAQIDRLLESGCFLDLEEVRREEAAQQKAAKKEEPTFVRAETTCTKLKSLFVSLFRMPDQTDAGQRSHEIAQVIREASQRNAACLIASLHFDSTNPYLVSHQVMGAVLVEQVGSKLGFDEAQRDVLVAAALTRDLGMGAMQLEVDKVHGPLPAPLMAQVKTHPERSVEILKRAKVTDPRWLTAVEQHHERLDGSGYPRGLKGDEIDRGARLISICDIFSAMIKPRPYRQYGRAKIPQAALRDIYTMGGNTLDKEFASVLVKTVGMVPPGSIVKLKNGEIALVHQPLYTPRQGKVLTLYDKNQMPVIEPQSRDVSLPEFEIAGVARHDECRSAQLIIKNILMKG
jgi:HD-GYP domain-containing protein (c-di-GMP phosphodiesterase class II)